MNRIFNQPVLNKFYRTLATSQDLVAVVGHDGLGHNIIYVFSQKNLTMKAYKYLKIDQNNYDFNIAKYIHKLAIV